MTLSGKYTIRLTPAELRKYADDIEANAEIVRREINATTEEVNTLRPTFVGQSASRFFKDFDSAQNDMRTWDETVLSFAQLLRQAATNLEKADNAGA